MKYISALLISPPPPDALFASLRLTPLWPGYLRTWRGINEQLASPKMNLEWKGLKGGGCIAQNSVSMNLQYRDEIYSLQILLSRTQAGPGGTVEQEQEEISPKDVQRINLISVDPLRQF